MLHKIHKNLGVEFLCLIHPDGVFVSIFPTTFLRVGAKPRVFHFKHGSGRIVVELTSWEALLGCLPKVRASISKSIGKVGFNDRYTIGFIGN